ncbi:hypothetical protein EDC96DRAFT_572933 [Choanephora cucurbitarum]|nr:hypothetical protein EDC96DRAFT_572933 [Choanephora cucurbitarum]
MQNEYGISIIANAEAIEKDFLPALQSAECTELDAPAGMYRVLQVDDERGQGGSGKRICEISEPLTRRRFPILYISTYQTDFVLVSEPQLCQVMEALREDGFEIESALPEIRFDLVTPHWNEDEGVLLDEVDKQPLSPIADPSRFLLATSVLVNELQCVGLNKHDRSIWVQTVLKILCYPELVRSDCGPDHKRFCSFVATSDDISIIADKQIIAIFDDSSLMQEQDAPAQKVIQVHFSGSNTDRYGIVRSISKPLSIDANINMLYLSSYMTANIIVSADDLERAVSIISPQKDLLIC